MRGRKDSFEIFQKPQVKSKQMDIFEDPQNPIFQKNDDVCQLFKTIHREAIQGQPIQTQIPFAARKTITAQCNKVLNGSTLYKCFDCQKHRFACICEECFMEGDHRGHRIEKKFVNYVNATCDCGNADIWKKSGFCPFHKGEEAKHLQQQKPNEEFKTHFCHYFGRLFELLFFIYLRHPQSQWKDKFHKLIYKKLISLIHDSSFYLECLYALFQGLKGEKLLSSIISVYSENFDELVFQFMNVALASEKLAYLIIRKYIKQINVFENFMKNGKNEDILFQIFAYREILQKLAQNQYLIVLSKQHNSKVMAMLFAHLKNQKPEDTHYYWKRFIEKGGLDIHAEDLTPKLIHQLLQSIKGDHNYFRIVFKTVVKEYQINQFSCKFFFRHLLMMCEGKIEKYMKAKQFLEYHQYQTKKVEQLLKFFIKNMENIESQILILGFLLLVQFSDLKNILQDQLKLQKIKNPLNRAQFACRLSYDVLDSIIEKLHLINQEYSLKTGTDLKLQERCKQYIKQTIYEMKTDINFLKKKFYLQQDLLKEIVKNHCKINERGQIVHELSSTYQYTAIRLISTKCHLEFNYGDKINNIEPYQQKIFNHLFSSKYQESLVNIVEEFVSTDFENKPYNFIEIQFQLSSLIIFFHTIYPESQILNQIVKKIKMEKQFRNKLFPKHPRACQTLMKNYGIQEQQRLNDQQALKKQLQKRKEKLEEIKKKKLLKIKEKQQKILQENPQQKEEKQKNQNTCLYCHQAGESLYYFGYLTVQNFIKQFLTKQQHSYVSLTYCPHFIHQSCYQNQFKDYAQSIRCPLCKGPSNIVLPYIDEKGQQENLWETRLQLMYSIETNTPAIKAITILLRYLIFAVGAQQVYYSKCKIRQAKYEAKRKMIRVVLNILQTYKQRFILKEQIQRLKNEFVSKETLAMMNKIIVIALESRLFEGTFEEAQKLLSEMDLQKSQFSIFLRSLSQITKFEFNDEKIEGKLTLLKKLQIKYQLPEAMSQFLKEKSLYCKECKKFQETVWQCILCGKSSCCRCQAYQKHTDQKHFGTSILIKFYDGKISYLRNLREYSLSLYMNSLQERWTHHDKPEGYYLLKGIISDFIRAYKTNDPQVLTIKGEQMYEEDDDDW